LTVGLISVALSPQDLLTQWLIVVLSQLRHIENRLEAAPGTGVLLDSVLDTKKASVSGGRKISRRGKTGTCSVAHKEEIH